MMAASRGGEAASRISRSGHSEVSLRPGFGLVAARALLVLIIWLSGPCGAAQEVRSSVKAVTSGNWTQMLKGHWIVEFYAPWCPACKQMQEDWETFAIHSSVLDIIVAKVDVTAEPGLSGRFFVTKLPTIFHVQNGEFRRYHGSRTVEDLHSFIKDEKWKMIEPVAGWKSPSSILMTGMAGLFYLSGWIRQTHNYFTGPLEMPVWGSYIVFIVATLLIGLFLGLVSVLLIDWFCPAKPKQSVIRSDIMEDVAELVRDTSDGKMSDKDASDEDEKGNQTKVTDEDASEEMVKQGRVDAEKESKKSSSEEDAGTEEEEELEIYIPTQLTPESQHPLRQRRNDVTVKTTH